MGKGTCTDGHHILRNLQHAHQAPVVGESPVADGPQLFRQYQFSGKVAVIKSMAANRFQILRKTELTLESCIGKSGGTDGPDPVMERQRPAEPGSVKTSGRNVRHPLGNHQGALEVHTTAER